MAILNEKRASICALCDAGMSPAQIAREGAVNLRTVQHIIKQYRTTGEWGKKSGGGRPRATTDAQDQSLLHRIEQEPKLSARALRAIENLPCTARTVNRRLHEGGKEQRRERLKEAALLNEAVRDKRVDWVMRVDCEWAGWFDRTIFVDECVFQSSACQRRTQWISADQEGRVFKYVRRSGRVSIAVFGGICGNEVLPLFVLAGSLKGETYRDILSLLYLPVLQEKFPGYDFRFVHDNCPAHTARAFTDWLEEEPAFSRTIIRLPPYSNDLNPIEHVWAAMKRRLNERIFYTKEALTEAVLNEWSRVGSEGLVRQLISSMPRRMNAVLAAQGGATKY